MGARGDSDVAYVVGLCNRILPSSSLKAVERVPGHVRDLLRIEVYEVTDDNRVRRLTA
ncbi:hypothetical protein [Streptomyces sp. NPDC003697]